MHVNVRYENKSQTISRFETFTSKFRFGPLKLNTTRLFGQSNMVAFSLDQQERMIFLAMTDNAHSQSLLTHSALAKWLQMF